MIRSTDVTAELDHTDEDVLYEVSDETLEAGHRHRGPSYGDRWTNDPDRIVLLTGEPSCSPTTRTGASPPTPLSCRSTAE